MTYWKPEYDTMEITQLKDLLKTCDIFFEARAFKELLFSDNGVFATHLGGA